MPGRDRTPLSSAPKTPIHAVPLRSAASARRPPPRRNCPGPRDPADAARRPDFTPMVPHVPPENVRRKSAEHKRRPRNSEAIGLLAGICVQASTLFSPTDRRAEPARWGAHAPPCSPCSPCSPPECDAEKWGAWTPTPRSAIGRRARGPGKRQWQHALVPSPKRTDRIARATRRLSDRVNWELARYFLRGHPELWQARTLPE
jgi:hypothetical protein